MAYSATYPQQSGTAGLRREVVDEMVKQTAKPAYKFKQALAISKTNAIVNTFRREDPTVLTGSSLNLGTELRPGANFPQAKPKYQEVSVRVRKFGLEDNIFWETNLGGDVPVQARTIIGLTLGVVKMLDDKIWGDLTEDLTTTPTGTAVIQSFAIGGAVGNGGCWDESSAAIIDNLMLAAQMIATNGHYDTSNLICFVSPRDKRSIMKYLVDKGTQFPDIASSIARNGKFGTLAGIDLIEAENVSASYSLVVKPKTCGSWREFVSLRSTTIEDPFKSMTIRVVEEGVLELHNPKAVVLIKNTQRT